MYERFTDRARKVMQLANQEAQRFNHEYIGTEHVLLGLVKEGTGVAAQVLKNAGIDLRKIRLEVEKIVQSGPDTVTMGMLPQTPRTKKVIEYAIEEARKLNHHVVGTEHLLLGLLREKEAVAAQVLMHLGLQLDDVYREIVNILGRVGEGGVDERAARTVVGPGPVEGAVPAFERLQAESVLRGQEVKIRKGLGLVIVPGGQEFHDLFHAAMEPAMVANGIDAVKAGDLSQPGSHLAQVWAYIRSAEVIVVDVSRSNPLVMYALGLCLGLHRCPILLVREPGELPFNLRSLRYIAYSNSTAGVEALRQDLTRAVHEFLSAARASGQED